MLLALDYSRPFIAAARELLYERRLDFSLKQEGHLFEQCTIHLPGAWDVSRIEFIMADAQAIPFRSHLFSLVASLNLVDKLPKPLHHLTEMNRTASEERGPVPHFRPFFVVCRHGQKRKTGWEAPAAAGLPAADRITCRPSLKARSMNSLPPGPWKNRGASGGRFEITGTILN